MKVKTFIRKWEGKPIEDWCSVMSDEFRTMFKDLRNTVKDICKEENAEVVNFRAGHYDASGFIKKDGKYLYISLSQDTLRYKVSVTESKFAGPILIRSAKNEKDYHGGYNHFCTLQEVGRYINDIIKYDI